MSELVLNPDRWLVCSAAIESSIRGPWADHSGQKSLLNLRIVNSQVERVSLDAAPRRVCELAERGCGTVHVVVEQLGEDERALIRALDTVDAPMRLHVWRDDPLDAIGSLNAPEDTVLQAWKAERRMPLVTAAPGDWPASFREEYQQALHYWAETTRADFPEEMAELYDAKVTALAEVLAALKAAAGATLSTGASAVSAAARRAVQISTSIVGDAGSAVIPVSDGGGLASGDRGFRTGFDTGAPIQDPVGIWCVGEGVSLSAPLPGYQSEGEFQLLAAVQASEMAVVARVVVTLVGTEDSMVVEYAAGIGSLEWLDDGRGGCFAARTIGYTDEVEQILSDPALIVTATFIGSQAPGADLPQQDTAPVMPPTATTSLLQRVAAALSTTIDRAAEMLAQLRQPSLLPAPMGLSPSSPQPQQRDHEAGFYTLTISPDLYDPNAYYLLFEMAPALQALGRDATVTVRIGETYYPLGQTNDQGCVELAVKGPIPTKAAIEVLISEGPVKPPTT